MQGSSLRRPRYRGFSALLWLAPLFTGCTPAQPIKDGPPSTTGAPTTSSSAVVAAGEMASARYCDLASQFFQVAGSLGVRPRPDVVDGSKEALAEMSRQLGGVSEALVVNAPSSLRADVSSVLTAIRLGASGDRTGLDQAQVRTSSSRMAANWMEQCPRDDEPGGTL